VPAVGLLTLIGLGTGVGVVLLVLSMILTTPLGVGPVGVTIWFTLLFGVLSGSVALLMFAAKSYFRVHATHAQRLRYSLRQGVLISGWLTGLLALSSLGQLGWRDVILLGLAAIIVELYVRFRWP
jgi:hypothetical protein